MNTAIETANSYTMVPRDLIVSRFRVRRLRTRGVARILDSMQRFGFQAQHPLLVARNDDCTYELLDGNHRLEAAIALNITMLPVHIIAEPLTDNDKKRLARQANTTTETMIPTTFVDDAELVWEEISYGKTQAEIGEILGWSRGKVSQYALLEKIDKQAWATIATTFDTDVAPTGDEDVARSATTVAFTEGLLRSILDLTPEQQFELVQALASGAIQKGKFKAQAENYKARNEMKTYALARLGDLGEPFTSQLLGEIFSGAYDQDWKHPDHPKLHKLLAALRDEWEKKNSIHLIHGDFYEEVKKIGDGSIDLILTDPPYNITRENEFELAGRSNISQDFGEWDKFSELQFIEQLGTWAAEWSRILREQGSGYVFTSDSYISHLRTALELAGLHVKATIVWHKTNPGTQVVKTNFKSSVEYILFFTKGEGGHTFNWQGENEMHNFIEAPICGGNERLTDAKGNTLHPTQKPEQVVRHFMEISSNRGDIVFDGFAGVGSTGAAAKRLGRKFIGIEQAKTFYDAAVRRLAE